MGKGYLLEYLDNLIKTRRGNLPWIKNPSLQTLIKNETRPLPTHRKLEVEKNARCIKKIIKK